MRKALVLLTVLLLVVTLGFGCGGEAEKETTENGGEAAEDLFTAEDLPTDVGTEWWYLENLTFGEIVTGVTPLEPVSFTFEGPWDFTEGPSDSEKVVTVVDKSEAPGSDKFPDAEFVLKTCDIFKPTTGDGYHFYSNEPDGVYGYGDYWPKFSNSNTYDPPVTWPYPYKTGYTSECTNQATAVEPDGTYTSTTTVTIRVVGVNQLKTPYKTFDTAFLLQQKETPEERTDDETVTYSWFVPGVGTAVTIACSGGEVDKPPTEAARVSRLTSFSKGSGRGSL